MPVPARCDKPILVCADDYGIAPGVSAAIRQLVAARRLSATSCMVVGAWWEEEAPRLRPFQGDVDIGGDAAAELDPDLLPGKGDRQAHLGAGRASRGQHPCSGRASGQGRGAHGYDREAHGTVAVAGLDIRLGR